MTKRYGINGASSMKRIDSFSRMGFDVVLDGDDTMQVSDGYRTMDELYEHRVTLWIALCRVVEHNRLIIDQINKTNTYCAWRSKLHSDGTEYEGWFVLGLNGAPGRQITYHLPLSRWEETEFAKTLERAPEYDGHTSADVLERLKRI